MLLGVWFARLDFTPVAIGNILGAGLAGGSAASLLVMLRGDRLGRRRVLVALALLSSAGTAAIAFTSDAWLIGAAAFLGMLNGMGRDRGASLALEQALLPSTTTDRERTRTFAWHALVQDVGHAVGSLLAGLPGLLRDPALPEALDRSPEEAGVRGTLLLGALLLALPGVLALRLSREIEASAPGAGRAPGGVLAGARLSPRSRPVVVRLSALFALDSLGSGFLLTSLVAYFFHERFGVDESVLGPLFFAARAINALSHLAAAWLARHIGLVNTMVFTHIPSSLLLATVPFAPSFPVAAALFLLREGLVEMDVPTRSSYVMAVVAPGERTFVSGITNLVRTGGWAVAPFVAGPLMERLTLDTTLWIGAGLKIAYDLLLWRSFRNVKPPEE